MIQSPAGYQGDVRVKRYLDFYQAGYGVAMLSSGVAFSPLSLFANGEQGAWYDPSDFSTMFQDAAGTTPVTAVEQPVGLLLDKSKGLALGAELVTNGTFDSGITGWTKSAGTTDPISWDSSGKRLIITNDIAYFASAYQTLSGLTVGKTYLVTGVISGSTVETRIQISFLSGGTSLSVPSGGGTARFVFVATSSSHSLVLQNNQSTLNGISYWDNISVRELPGNHASQSTAASRPVLSARVNQLTYTEAFTNAAWTKTGMTIAATGVSDPFGGTAATTIKGTATNSANQTYQSNTTVPVGVSTLFSIWVRRRTGSGTVRLKDQNGIDFTNITSSLTSSWQRFTLTSFPNANGYFYPGITVETLNDEIDVYGADLRVTNVGVNLPAYQRVAAATDYDTSGFPLYLKFDGTDDFLVSGSDHPFTYTGAVSLFAGFRKIGTTKQFETLFACGVVGNSTVNNVKSMGFQVTDSGNNRLATDIWSPAGIRGSTTLTSPVSGVAAFNIANWSTHKSSGASITLNGVAEPIVAYGAADPTALNTSKMYIGVFDPAPGVLPSSFFTGNIYGLIARNAQSSADEITSTSTWLNEKTKAY